MLIHYSTDSRYPHQYGGGFEGTEYLSVTIHDRKCGVAWGYGKLIEGGGRLLMMK